MVNAKYNIQPDGLHVALLTQKSGDKFNNMADFNFT
jgi:hypothetical protein